jgi:hypothetical protein
MSFFRGNLACSPTTGTCHLDHETTPINRRHLAINSEPFVWRILGEEAGSYYNKTLGIARTARDP